MTQPTQSPVRIAVISTPRSGNTWVRTLLARLYDVPQVAFHSMEAEDWDGLAPRCLLQLHAHHTPELQERLNRMGFKVVSLARHPLDVLISILHFSHFESNTARWLEGEAGDEKGLILALPNSKEFTHYGCGPRAKALLGLTAEWWDQPACINLRYEDLVADPHGRLRWLVDRLGWPPEGDTIEQAVEACSLDVMRKASPNNHYWKGQPGSWRQFLTADVAQCFATAHQDVSTRLGYDCVPDTGLSAEQANATWQRLIREEWWPFLEKNQKARERLLRNVEEAHQATAHLADQLEAIHRSAGERTLAIGLRVARFLHTTLGWTGTLFGRRKAA